MEELGRRKRERKADFFSPYPWQKKFVAATLTYGECAAFKGNRVGGTLLGAFMAYCFTTGNYPDWWEGRRFEGPTRGVIVGVDFGQIKRGAQRLLFGQDYPEWGVGPEADPHPIMPCECILKQHLKKKKEDTNVIDTALIEHVSGDASSIMIISQKQSQDTLMGDELHWAWCDEFPENEKMYTQLIPRVETTDGLIFVTSTPEKGRTSITDRYLKDNPLAPDGRPITYHQFVHKRDALHYSEEKILEIIAACPPHERKFRIEGKPVYGAGLIFETPSEGMLVGSDEIPEARNCRHICGFDPGISDFGALIWLRFDEISNCWYVTDMEKIRGKQPKEIARIMERHDRAIGMKIPVSYGRDACNKEITSGDSLRNMLAAEGINVIKKPAHNAFARDNDNARWPGINYMIDLMKSGGLKILDSPRLRPLLDEKDLYYCDEHGNIPKKKEQRFDVIDALRYGLMMGRYAKYPASEGHGGLLTAITKQSAA